MARAASFHIPLAKPFLPPSFPYSRLHVRGYGRIVVGHRGSHFIPVRVDYGWLITSQVHGHLGISRAL